MKKSTKIAGIVLGLGVVFSAGAVTGANSNWKTEVVNEASARIGNAGYLKKEELIKNADIGSEMKQILNPAIATQEQEVARLLQEYYNLKLQGLTESEDYKQIEAQLETLKLGVIERYKKDIDALFVGQ